MNLVINSQFRPFTYDEMVKPLVQYKEAYDKVEQDYSDLIKQTEMWKDVANQTNSPEAYEMYNRYSNDLAAITEDFSRGMNLNNSRKLLNMKRRYYQDIDPIAKADAAMKEANELRAKAGHDAIFEVGQYNSLDQFLHGKTANNNYISREALTKKTAAMTEAAMAEALQDPEFKKYMGDQYWLITQHTGGSYADLMDAIKNNPKAQNRFAQIKQRVMADAGIDRYDSRGKVAIEEAINTGLYAGLDKPARSLQANQAYLNPLQEAQRTHYLESAGSGGRGRSSKVDSDESDSDDFGEDDYMVQDIILEESGNGYAASNRYDYGRDPSKAHGYLYTGDISELPRKQREAIEGQIGSTNRNLYEIRRWRDSETGRNHIQIRGKKSAPKAAPKNVDSSIDVVSSKYKG